MSEIKDIINELRGYDSEREWFELKENWFAANELGEYVSALSNSAAIDGKKTPISYGVYMMKTMRLQEQILTITRM